MTGKQLTLTTAVSLTVLCLGLVAWPALAQDCPDIPCAEFARLSGAIFTTDQTGQPVNMNIYNNKKFVYLDGGPGPGAPVGAAALPEGCYYFQVTDPPGKTLLSTDSLENRRFFVNSYGVIDSAYNHHTEPDADYGSEYGAVVVQLMPFDDTPNPGGVYKVWVTPVGCLGDPEEDGSFGFIPRYCKTDNFKVKGEIEQFLCVRKFKDCDGDGIWDLADDADGDGQGDPAEPELSWSVDIMEPVDEAGNRVVRYDVSIPFPDGCILAWDGWWTVVETLPTGCFGWQVTAQIIDDTPQEPSVEAWVLFDGTDLKRNGTETHTIVFGNRPLSSIKVVKFADCDLDGQKDEGEAVIADIKFELYDENGDPALDGFGQPVPPATTDENGEAVFCGLPAGTYYVVEALTPDQEEDWYPSEPVKVEIKACADPGEVTVEVPNIPLGCVVACKFYDRNTNGAWDKGEPWFEPGIPGFKMNLWMGDPADGGVFLETGYTGADGCVSFCGLLPGWYTVCEIMPPETLACPWVATTSESKTVELELCGPDATVAFGNVLTGTTTFFTKGFWQNKNGLTDLTAANDASAGALMAYVNGLLPYEDDSPYFEAGDEPFDGYFDGGAPVAAAFSGDDVVWEAGTWQSEVSHFLTDNNSNADLNDHKEQLAQQLLAFIFNVEVAMGGRGSILVGGVFESTDYIIQHAIDLWAGSDDAAIVAWKDKLDGLNNNNGGLGVTYVRESYEGCVPSLY